MTSDDGASPHFEKPSKLPGHPGALYINRLSAQLALGRCCALLRQWAREARELDELEGDAADELQSGPIPPAALQGVPPGAGGDDGGDCSAVHLGGQGIAPISPRLEPEVRPAGDQTGIVVGGHAPAVEVQEDQHTQREGEQDEN
jgi:hypothetical protein